MKKGQKVTIKEGRYTWTGTIVGFEQKLGMVVWALIEPTAFITHIARASTDAEYSENLIRIPVSLPQINLAQI